jgi:rhodanese-related sulfurtransferase
MRERRRIAIGLVALAAAALWLLWRRPPPTDTTRRWRIERWSRAFSVAFPDVPDLSAEDLLERLGRGDDVVLVDVRAPTERRVSTLPGAIDAATFLADPTRFGGRPVVAYCTLGGRSARWARVRRNEGHDVRSLRGGVLAWTHAGGELLHAGEPTRRVHVYGPRFALQRRDHQPVW